MPKDAKFHYHFAKSGYTIISIRYSRLITSDHWILIGCSTFLRTPRASSCDVTTIEKVTKIYFCLYVSDLFKYNISASVLTFAFINRNRQNILYRVSI